MRKNRGSEGVRHYRADSADFHEMPDRRPQVFAGNRHDGAHITARRGGHSLSGYQKW
jgi:hypothetical protein